MLWFVYIDNYYVGTVIAENELHALECAERKFSGQLSWGLMTVEKRRR